MKKKPTTNLNRMKNKADHKSSFIFAGKGLLHNFLTTHLAPFFKEKKKFSICYC